MNKIAIMTDSNCGLTPEESRSLGIYMLPMPVIIDNITYFENVDITPEEFYSRQTHGAGITSSQPSPASVTDMWNELLKSYDEVVYIPMTSALSGSCLTAETLAEDYEGRVHVVDNLRISVLQAQSAMDAVKLAGEGKTGAEIKAVLEEEACETTIYISVSTLTYLKKGGRITPAAAAVGTVLNIKPILTIQSGKLDAFSKARGLKAAFHTMLDALENDINTRFKALHESGRLQLAIACTAMPENERQHWISELKNRFPGESIAEGRLTLSIGCHTGEGSIGIGAYIKHN